MPYKADVQLLRQGNCEMMVQTSVAGFFTEHQCFCLEGLEGKDCVVLIRQGVFGAPVLHVDDGKCNWYENVQHPAGGTRWGCIDEYCEGDLSVHFCP